MEDVPVGFAYRPEAVLAVIAAAVFPGEDRAREDAGAVVETDAAFAQVLGVLASSHSNSIADDTLTA
jgi:hypothetical protein